MAVQITVTGITPPGAGKKQGHIIDTSGKKWNVWGDKLHNFELNRSYNITYDINEFNGTKFDVIKTAELIGANLNPAPQTFTPQPTGPRHAQTPQYTAQPSAKDEMIFICGALNNSLGNQNVNPMMLTGPDIIGLIEKFRMAWRNTLGKTQQNSTDIVDQIPFS